MRYIDIIILAKDIQRHIKFDKEKILPIHVISPNGNDVKSAVLQYYNSNPIDLSIRLTKTSDMHKRGMFRLYKKKGVTRQSAVINFSNELNDCWRRFVTTKELIHLVISINPKTWTHVTLDGVKEVFDLKEIALDSDIHLEDLAKLLALEILCPFIYNDEIINSPLSSYQLAEQFMIPEKAIDRIRSKQYQKLRIEAYRDLD